MRAEKQQPRVKPWLTAKRVGGVVTTCALATAFVGAGSLAANADETHDSEALASVLTADLLGLDLADLNEIQSSFLGDGLQKKSPVGVDLLGLNLTIPELNIPLLSDGSNNGLLNLGDLGAALATAQSPYSTTSTAQAATVSEDGAIDLDGTSAAEGGSTKIDLTQLFEQLGLSDVSDQILDVAEIELGALASQASVEEGVANGQYTIADAKLTLRSPLVAGLTDTLSSTVVNGLADPLDTIAGADGALDTLLSSLNVNLLNLLQVTTEGGTATVNGIDGLLAGITDDILTGQIHDESGLVTIDLGTGEIIVNLEKIIDGDDLNGLDPNTPLLDGATLASVSQAITGLLDSVVGDVVEAVRDAVSNVSIDVNVPLEINIGEVDVDLLRNLSVQQVLDLSSALGINAGPLQILLTFVGGTADQLLGTVIDTALGLPLVGSLVENVLDLVLAPIDAALPDNLATAQIAASIDLGAVLNGEDGISVTVGEVSLADGVTDAILEALGLGTLGEALSGVVVEPVEGILNDLATQVVSPLIDQVTEIDTLLDGLLTPLLSETLQPLFEALPGIVQVTINHQPTLLGEDDYFQETLGYTGEGAFTVNALNVKVLDALGGDELVDLSLASSSVRALAEDPYAPTLDADDTVEAGDDLGVDGGSWVPGSDVDVIVEDGEGNQVGDAIEVTVDENGDFPADVVYPIPADATEGDDYVVVGTDEYGHEVEDVFGVTVTPDQGADADPDQGADADPDQGADADPDQGADADPDQGADADPDQGADVDTNADADVDGSDNNADENSNASASASASANADDNSNAAAQVAAQAAAQADATTAASAAANADATSAAQSAANADASSDASTDVTSEANASAQAASQAAAQADASSTSNADGSSAAEGNAGAAAAAASNADSSSDASAAAAANADADADGSDNNADENTNASASASASANADDDSNASAQAAAQAAAQADATSAASAAANADATAAAQSAATADASTAASADVSSAANASSVAAAQAAAQADASSASNADASSAADANAAAAASAASNADSSSTASATAAADSTADVNGDADAAATDSDSATTADTNSDADADASESETDSDSASASDSATSSDSDSASDSDDNSSASANASSSSTADASASSNSSSNASSSSNANASADADAKSLSIDIEQPRLQVGEKQTVHGHGFDAGEKVTAVQHSTPYSIGSGVADENGDVTFTWNVPASSELGKHSVELTGATSGSISATFEVYEKKKGELSPTGGDMALPLGGAAALLMIAGAGVWFATSRRRSNS